MYPPYGWDEYPICACAFVAWSHTRRGPALQQLCPLPGLALCRQPLVGTALGSLLPWLLLGDWPLAVVGEGDSETVRSTTTLTEADNRLTELGLTSTTIRRLLPYWHAVTGHTAHCSEQRTARSALASPPLRVSLRSWASTSTLQALTEARYHSSTPWAHGCFRYCRHTLPSLAHHQLVRRLALPSSGLERVAWQSPSWPAAPHNR